MRMWPGRRAHGPCRGVSHTIIEELVDSPRSPFHALGLAEHQKAGGYERAARRQVSQLRRLKADPGALALEAAPDWPALFADPTRPLVVDLGCGAGRCMLLGAAASQARSLSRAAAAAGAAAPAETRAAAAAGACSVSGSRSSGGGGGSGGGSGGGGGGCNFLGVDVRLALTSRANAWAGLLGLSSRAAFLCANANACLPLLLGSYGSSGSTSCSSSTSNGSSSPSTGSSNGSPGPGPITPERQERRLAGTAGGRVALVCLQFSDPVADRGPEAGRNWRREALVGGGELVRQLAAALEPGALVWVQSDVLSTAASFRRLFWQHGGFAPSARHAAATSATRTREWLGPAAAAPGSASPGPASETATAAREGGAPAAVGAGSLATAADRPLPAALLPPRQQPQPHSELQPPQLLPLLLTAADLATHQEPWLTEQQVAEASERHAAARRQAGTGCCSALVAEAGLAEASEACRAGGEGATGEEDGWCDLPWLDSNPLGVPTERELYVERGSPKLQPRGSRDIYRLLLVRL
ncbi:hypothetical protein HXX76_012262 [Chlamydomonas incerta]|uniref:tRNA (guanine(46)-N(7))-methyltransferase n=1 Tax=Chlamydomonas incerta TaxID=51695 RepID=A0A835SSS9_CHLIN|nr:hypothetical protein HXX76_012262 [Chlamydomonas incerta]|eukprot:KAG2427609.1 hypothetical protein HXX76_012262 [Chlamydomonas incerta]